MCIHGTHGHTPEQLKPSLRMLQQLLPVTTGCLMAPAEQLCPLGEHNSNLKEKPTQPLKALQQRVPLVQTTGNKWAVFRSVQEKSWARREALEAAGHPAGIECLRPRPEVGAKHTEWKGKFSPAWGHHRPWRCKSEHRKEPGFNQGFQIKIPAPLFPISKMSDAVLPAPLHIAWPFLFQLRGNPTHTTIKIILSLLFLVPLLRRLVTLLSLTTTSTWSLLEVPVFIGGEGETSVLTQHRSKCALRHRAGDSYPVSQFCWM